MSDLYWLTDEQMARHSNLQHRLQIGRATPRQLVRAD